MRMNYIQFENIDALNGDRIALDLLYEESFEKIKDFIRDRL